MDKQYLLVAVSILLLAFVQNISFSIASRSRNRDNLTYHLIASVFSNGIWFLTFRELVRADMTLTLFVPYTLGTVSGSLLGAKISMLIERFIGATSDGHVKPAPLTADEVGRIVRAEMIRDRQVQSDIKAFAKKLWRDAGSPSGKDLDFWLEAERQVG